ncbi:DUF2334 domain-containing protein [Kocuria coralli]|uniref:DUF2334 domain-containing protein n=1 Tax=Kocuria coralli TaxID=1461025 RepID=A0A5J5L236_9MICC|nr:DUF2334 domain-containing protein [Kocuria coralli]KAA9395618.1 DUF2334 domain-containing protein [Kocuria coralli]
MNDQYRLSKMGRAAWAVALVAIPLISAGLIFGLTDDSIVEHQGSKVAEKYAVPIDQISESDGSTPQFSSTWGEPGGSKTLVLYDADGEYPEDAELYAVAVGNLATHFGEVEAVDLALYQENQMDSFDAVIYLGTDDKKQVPQPFLQDVREGQTPVMWMEQNIDELATFNSPDGEDFIAQYGWNGLEPLTLDSSEVTFVDYKDQQVGRHAEGVDLLNAPRVVDPQKAEVLVHGLCGEPSDLRQCVTDDPDYIGESVPWAVRSGNLTYLAEIPLNYITENNLYLVFADLLYDPLGPDVAPVKQAAVRFEDVGPEANPEQLRAVADYLHSRDIPFQVAVMPVQIDRTKAGNDWYGLTLLDAPQVVDALKYMQDRGGTLIQHGTSHQYGATNNPYSGRSGDDYEFYEYGCTSNEAPPYEFEECKDDSWVTKKGPVPADSVDDHKQRMDEGRQVMIEAGLGEPEIFETPHYTASVNAYKAMTELYDARYEQGEYFAGALSGEEISTENFFGQVFPYSVHDFYGQKVYPENLENITLKEQNNHAARSPETLIDRARTNLVVRESTASFYFHPFLDIGYLDQVVTGIEDLGYEFVPVTELK